MDRFREGLVERFLTAALSTAASVGGVASPFFVDKKVRRIARNVPYGDDASASARKLDVYAPKEPPAGGRALPVAILIHGGGFSFFSKESDAAAAGRLAASGRLVFCIDYRLAPAHPYPAALEDAIAAYRWVLENAARYGGDVGNLALAGESAGGNLVFALALWLWDLAPFAGGRAPKPETRPRRIVVHCGHLQVSDADRYGRDPGASALVRARVRQIQKQYLPSTPEYAGADRGLADPLVVVEKRAAEGAALPEGFPPVFIPVGGRDPVIGDSRRLARALEGCGGRAWLKVYPGQGHSFYAAPFKAAAKECWNDIDGFLS